MTVTKTMRTALSPQQNKQYHNHDDIGDVVTMTTRKTLTPSHHYTAAGETHVNTISQILLVTEAIII